MKDSPDTAQYSACDESGNSQITVDVFSQWVEPASHWFFCALIYCLERIPEAEWLQRQGGV